MPGFDRTGPMGQGPQTGGGFGRCNDAGTDEDLVTGGYGEWRGVGRGGLPWGGGRGRCFGGRQRGFRRRGMGRGYADLSERNDSTGIADRLSQLEKENNELRQRIVELESKQ